MIKRLFNGQINSITLAALLVALSSLVSRFLGLFRDRILAGEFGAGDTLDVYYAAFRFPDLMFNLLVLGALSAGFIPTITCLIKDPICKARTMFSKSPNKEAWLLASNILNIIALALGAISVFGIVFAPYLMKLIAPGFEPDKQVLTANLTRVMLLSPIFLGISSVFGGILQSFKRFFVYSLSPILYNIGIIIGALYLVPIWGVYGLAWGVVFGSLLHMLVQLPTVFSLGYKYTPVLNLRNANIRRIGIMMIPRTMTLAVSQLNLVVITIVASTLAGGSLAIFNFANNLQSFPVGIFGISFAIAAFPTLSAVAFKKKLLVENFSRTFRQILFFIIPATIILYALRAQIIRVILGTGLFNWEDTRLTIQALGFFTISLFAQATIPLLIRVFYARQNSKTPFFIGLSSVAVNVGLSLWLPGLVVCRMVMDQAGIMQEVCSPLGVTGLALAFSIAQIFNFVLLWIVLRIEIDNLDEKRVFASVLKFSSAAVLAGVVVQGIKIALGSSNLINMDRLWGVLLQGFTAGAGGIIIYLFICALLKSEEFFSFWGSIRRRLPWKKVEAGDQGEARGI